RGFLSSGLLSDKLAVSTQPAGTQEYQQLHKITQLLRDFSTASPFPLYFAFLFFLYFFLTFLPESLNAYSFLQIHDLFNCIDISRSFIVSYTQKSRKEQS